MVVVYEDMDDCGNARLRVIDYVDRPLSPAGATNPGQRFVLASMIDSFTLISRMMVNIISAEHIIEGNTPSLFFTNLNRGTLPSGLTPRLPPPPLDFFNNFLFESRIHGTSDLIGGANPTIPMNRLAETLGSRRYVENFVILSQLVNAMKARV